MNTLKSHLKIVDQLCDDELLILGEIAAPTDFAVRYYRMENHPKFFKNRPVLLKTIKRAMRRFWVKNKQHYVFRTGLNDYFA